MAQHTSARQVWAAWARRAVLGAAIGSALAVAPRTTAQAATPSAGPTTAPAAVPPAVQEIQDDLDQKQFAPAIRAASKLLAQRGDAAGGFSRFQVTMLKGDAQLGSRNLSAARTTYQQAVRETNDPHERALATWTVELLRRARGTAYVPHVAGPSAAGTTPIDLTDSANRQAAFAALLDDELSVLGPKLKQAASTQSLPQILPVVKQVEALAELDQIANGSETRTAGTAGGLVEHARNLMASALKGMWTRTSDIYASATQTVTAGGGTALVNGMPIQQTTTTQNGLTGDNANELRAMIDTCGKIREAAQAFIPLAQGADDKGWEAVLNDATRVAGRAADVLNGNYSSFNNNYQYPNDLGGSLLNNGYLGGSNVYVPPGGNGTSAGRFPNGSNTPPSRSGGGNTTGGGSTSGGGTHTGGGTGNPPRPPRSQSSPTSPPNVVRGVSPDNGNSTGQ